jgi:T-complex protein 1 subunit gamma
MCNLAYEAVKNVIVQDPSSSISSSSSSIFISSESFSRPPEIDLKRYAKIEKIPGGAEDMSCVLDGVMINKDCTHPAMKKFSFFLFFLKKYIKVN